MSERLPRREFFRRGLVVVGGLVAAKILDKHEFFDPQTVEADVNREAFLRELDFRDLLDKISDRDDLNHLNDEALEAAFGANFELNPSFTEDEVDISIGDVKKPKHWDKVLGVGLEDYVQNSQARSGGRCIKIRVFNRVNKCNLFSGAWESEDPIKINPDDTFQGGFWAKFKPLGDVHEIVRPRMIIIPLTKQGDSLDPIVFAPNLKSVGIWESYRFNFGQGTPRELPEETYAILRRFDAAGRAVDSSCNLTSLRGDVLFDDVSLRKAA